MFTGIVESTGRVARIERRGETASPGDSTLLIECPGLDRSATRTGDSISVSGVCLTVVEFLAEGLRADVSLETLRCTTLGSLEPGSTVNLESALRLSTPLGGHLVSGHVDAVAVVRARAPEVRSVRFDIELPDRLARYVAVKGSICVDGVSLTVNEIEAAAFTVNIVPHTLAVTTIGSYEPGVRVNLEVDLIARYLERLLG